MSLFDDFINSELKHIEKQAVSLVVTSGNMQVTLKKAFTAQQIATSITQVQASLSKSTTDLNTAIKGQFGDKVSDVLDAHIKALQSIVD